MKKMFYGYINGIWKMFRPVLEQIDSGKPITIVEQDQLADEVNDFHNRISLTGNPEVDEKIKEEIGLAAADFFAAIMSMAAEKGLLETA